MTDDVSLSRKQRLAVAALMSASTIADAARAAGVSDRQVYRWMRDDDFRQALNDAEERAIDDAVRSMIADLRSDLDVIAAIRDDDNLSPGIRLRAAVSHSDRLLAWRSLRNVELRLSWLERIANDQAKGRAEV